MAARLEYVKKKNQQPKNKNGEKELLREDT